MRIINVIITICNNAHTSTDARGGWTDKNRGVKHIPSNLRIILAYNLNYAYNEPINETDLCEFEGVHYRNKPRKNLRIIIYGRISA